MLVVVYAEQAGLDDAAWERTIAELGEQLADEPARARRVARETGQLHAAREHSEVQRGRDKRLLDDQRGETKLAQASLADAEALLAKSERARLAARAAHAHLD